MSIGRMTMLAISLILVGCIPMGGSDTPLELTNKLNDLLAKKSQNPAAVEGELAKLTGEAQLAAKGEEQPQTKVAMYRIASIAAWQAGAAQGPKPLEIQREGEQACAALPANQPRPTDCAIITLASALAVADDLQTQLDGLKRKQKDATSAHKAQCETLAGSARTTCLNTRAKLPQSDGEIIKNDIFPGFRNQYDKVTAMRTQMGSITAIDDSLLTYTDTERVILYCSALTSLTLLQDCQGSAAGVAELNDDLTVMQCRLKKPSTECVGPDPANLAFVDCDLQPPDGAPVLAAKDS